MTVHDQKEEVQRILQAPQFRRASKLQRFLELICDYHFQNRSAEINEFVLATEVFGKGPGFEPSEDSLVRVQAREVRRRLREYYQNDGKSSHLILDIPVGSYAPVFTAVGVPALVGRAPSIKAAWLMLAGTVLACAALLIAADRERRLLLRSTALAAEQMNTLSPSLAGLWNRFLDSDVPTILVVSNPDVGECADRQPGTTGCADEYTGMGEAVAIHLITSLYRSAQKTLIVKQSRIVNADDIKRHNLVLLGGKSVNVWTRRLGQDLSLDLPDPSLTQPYATAFDAKTGKITMDRALVALRKQPSSGRWVLILYGRHSQGTHAAAEAATGERFLAQLKWPASTAPFPDNFHVLVSVSVNEGIPEGPIPVAVRIP
jgi:hypothetical protein